MIVRFPVLRRAISVVAAVATIGLSMVALMATPAAAAPVSGCTSSGPDTFSCNIYESLANGTPSEISNVVNLPQTIAGAGYFVLLEPGGSQTDQNTWSDVAYLIDNGGGQTNSLQFFSYGCNTPTTPTSCFPSVSTVASSPHLFLPESQASTDDYTNVTTCTCGTHTLNFFSGAGPNVAHPTISTTASPTGLVGGSISNSATIAAANNPTGNLTFKAFGPNDPGCIGPVAYSAPVPLVSGTTTYSSGNFFPTAGGTYNWVVSYPGDGANAAAGSPCGATGETSTVTVPKATPTISTTASAPVRLGGQISDSATITGANAPTGSLTFKAFGPNNSGCAGTPAFVSTVVLTAGTTTYSSGSFTPPAAGNYNWTVSYPGDGNNNAAQSPCGAANETGAVTLPCDQPVISGSIPGSLVLDAGKSYCVINATVGGSITVPAGTSVFIFNSTVKGGITANGAGTFTLCGSHVVGPVSVQRSTGFVLIGDPTDDGCPGNTIDAAVTLTNNQGGAEVISNTIRGTLTVNGTTGAGPFPEDNRAEIEHNTIGGSLACSGNSPAPTSEGDLNSVAGPSTGQCLTGF